MLGGNNPFIKVHYKWRRTHLPKNLGQRGPDTRKTVSKRQQKKLLQERSVVPETTVLKKYHEERKDAARKFVAAVEEKKRTIGEIFAEHVRIKMIQCEKNRNLCCKALFKTIVSTRDHGEISNEQAMTLVKELDPTQHISRPQRDAFLHRYALIPQEGGWCKWTMPALYKIELRRRNYRRMNFNRLNHISRLRIMVSRENYGVSLMGPDDDLDDNFQPKKSWPYENRLGPNFSYAQLVEDLKSKGKIRPSKTKTCVRAYATAIHYTRQMHSTVKDTRKDETGFYRKKRNAKIRDVDKRHARALRAHLLTSGDVEENPGPKSMHVVIFVHTTKEYFVADCGCVHTRNSLRQLGADVPCAKHVRRHDSHILLQCGDVEENPGPPKNSPPGQVGGKAKPHQKKGKKNHKLDHSCKQVDLGEHKPDEMKMLVGAEIADAEPEQTKEEIEEQRILSLPRAKDTNRIFTYACIGEEADMDIIPACRIKKILEKYNDAPYRITKDELSDELRRTLGVRDGPREIFERVRDYCNDARRPANLVVFFFCAVLFFQFFSSFYLWHRFTKWPKIANAITSIIIARALMWCIDRGGRALTDDDTLGERVLSTKITFVRVSIRAAFCPLSASDDRNFVAKRDKLQAQPNCHRMKLWKYTLIPTDNTSYFSRLSSCDPDLPLRDVVESDGKLIFDLTRVLALTTLPTTCDPVACRRALEVSAMRMQRERTINDDDLHGVFQQMAGQTCAKTLICYATSEMRDLN